MEIQSDDKLVEAHSDHPVGEKAWTTRRAPHMERFVEIIPYSREDEPDHHRVFLKIGNQRFECGSGDGCRDAEEAAWWRDMLCIALDNLVREHAQRQGERT